MNLDTLSRATGISPSLVPLWAGPLTAAMAKYEINTPRRQAHFLAQVGHESGGFTRLVENLNYSADALLRNWPTRFNAETAAKMARRPEAIANYVYGGRLGNGADGDGWKYRGRGLIQLTGKGNYRSAGIALGLDLLGKPELLEKPDAASLSAAWFWKTNGLNELADKGDMVAVTRRVNGGTNGLDDRKARYDRAAKALGL